jgi:hypothetical protein
VRVGFTGTRRGLTIVQQNVLRAELAHLHPQLLVHGACIGADNEADQIAVELGIPRLVYPSTARTRILDSVLQARAALTILNPLPPLVRDKLIVAASEVVIACPWQYTEQRRSGTWATVRYARAAGRPVIIIGPGGIK